MEDAYKIRFEPKYKAFAPGVQEDGSPADFVSTIK